MATTYELIDSVVLESNAASVTFSSIPATYDDLFIVISGRCTNTTASDGQQPLLCKFNGTDYALTRRGLYSTGSSAASYSNSSSTNRFLVSGLVNSAANYSPNVFSSVEVYIPNYTSASNKSISATAVNEGNVASTVYMEFDAALLPLTSAITSMQFYPASSDLTSGSSFHLYGITKA